MARPPDELVQDFLRGQNLEQVGRVDEAVAIYEGVVENHFDAAGPYDRLIWIYQSRGLHHDVIRIAEASIERVRTYTEKVEWYRQQISLAREALTSNPQPRER